MDWTETNTWDCNGHHPPGGDSAYDGTTLHPLETMFTEVDRLKLYSGLSSSRAAKRYDLWQHAQVGLSAPVLYVCTSHGLLESSRVVWTCGSTPRGHCQLLSWICYVTSWVWDKYCCTTWAKGSGASGMLA